MRTKRLNCCSLRILSQAQSKFCGPCCWFFCPSHCFPILERNLLVMISLPTQATFPPASHSFPNSFASLPLPTLGPTLWLVNPNPLQTDFSLPSHFTLPFLPSSWAFVSSSLASGQFFIAPACPSKCRQLQAPKCRWISTGSAIGLSARENASFVVLHLYWVLQGTQAQEHFMSLLNRGKAKSLQTME